MHEQLDTLQVNRFDGLHHYSFALMHLSNCQLASSKMGRSGSSSA